MFVKAHISFSEFCIYLFLGIYLYTVNFYGAGIVMLSVGGILLAHLINEKGRIKFQKANYYIVYLFSFAVINILSSMWAVNAKYSIDMGIRLIETAIIMFFYYQCFCNRKNVVNNILLSLMYSSYAVCIYVVLTIGWDHIYQLAYTGMRITSDDIANINPNSIGAFALFGILINLYFILYIRKINLTDILIIPAFIILISSQSRKALLCFVVGILLLFILKNYKSGNLKSVIWSLTKIIAIIIVFIILLNVLSTLPQFEPIFGRFANMLRAFSGEKADGWLRMQYTRLGLTLFGQRPLFGFGSDNSRFFVSNSFGFDVYLHNNFLELVVNLGLVGLVVYYSVFINSLNTYFKYKRYRSPQLDICFTLLIVRLIYDFGQVNYYGRDTAIYVLLFVLEASKLKQIAMDYKGNNQEILREHI